MLDMTAMNGALKELYNEQYVANLVYKANPALAMIAKNTDFGGEWKPIPCVINNSQGRSANFNNAQGNQTSAITKKFLLDAKSDYSIATIDGKTMAASRTDKMAFISGSKLLIDSAWASLKNSLASKLFRSGTGTIGQIGSISGNVVTMANIVDICQFENNMTLVVSNTDGGTAVGSPDVGYITAIDRSAGTFTIGGGVPGTWAQGQYLTVQGDTNAAISGFAAWLPTTISGADNFYQVNRSIDRTRLGGLYYPQGAGQTIEEALQDAAALTAEQGATPDVCFVNYRTYSALTKQMGSRVQYVDLKGPGLLMFRGVYVQGPAGDIKVMPDRNCQSLTGWMLQMDTWALESIGEAPMTADQFDGLPMLRLGNADAGEVRVLYYANASCNAPGWNCRLDLSA